MRQRSPKFLQQAIADMESPSSLFDEYMKTGEPMFREAAGRARKNLLDAANNPEETVKHYHLKKLHEQLQKKQAKNKI